jgi:hypothetical protein
MSTTALQALLAAVLLRRGSAAIGFLVLVDGHEPPVDVD